MEIFRKFVPKKLKFVLPVSTTHPISNQIDVSGHALIFILSQTDNAIRIRTDRERLAQTHT